MYYGYWVFFSNSYSNDVCVMVDHVASCSSNSPITLYYRSRNNDIGFSLKSINNTYDIIDLLDLDSCVVEFNIKEGSNFDDKNALKKVINLLTIKHSFKFKIACSNQTSLELSCKDTF